jgi:transposase InsO family protein
MQEEAMCLILVTEAYSRKSVGYYYEAHMLTVLVGKALMMALRQRRGNQPLGHYFDRAFMRSRMPGAK